MIDILIYIMKYTLTLFYCYTNNQYSKSNNNNKKKVHL